MENIMLKQQPWNRKVNTIEELAQKSIDCFNEAINHYGFVGAIQTTAEYFGFGKRITKSNIPLLNYKFDKYNSKYMKDIESIDTDSWTEEEAMEMLGPDSEVYKKQLEFSEFVEKYAGNRFEQYRDELIAENPKNADMDLNTFFSWVYENHQEVMECTIIASYFSK
jgi:hypothetical protein